MMTRATSRKGIGTIWPSHERNARRASDLNGAFHHHLFDIGDRLGWVQSLWTRLGTIHDRVTAVQFEGVFKIVQTFAGRFITTVDDPPVRVKQGGWPEVAIAIPPVTWARRRTTGTHDAFVQTVQLRPVID